MRVLMVSTDRKAFDERSNVRQRFREYAHALTTYRHKGSELHVIVFSKKENGFSPVVEGNLFLHPTNALHRLGYLLEAYRIGKGIGDISVVTTQDPFETGLVGWRLARHHRARFNVQVHTDVMNPYFKRFSFLNRARVLVGVFLMRRASSIRVVSKRIAESLLPLRLRAPVSILPIYTDLRGLWEGGGENLKSAYPQFSRHVLVVSRLEEEKNVALAIEAFAKASISGAGLFIVGEGSKRDELKKTAQNLGLSEKVVFMGWKDKLTGLYESADALLVTSFYEGYGLSMAEAAALGCPFVAVDVGIARELFNLGARCTIVDRSSPELAAALADVLRNGRAMAGDFILGLTGFSATKEEYLKRYIDTLTNT